MFILWRYEGKEMMNITLTITFKLDAHWSWPICFVLRGDLGIYIHLILRNHLLNLWKYLIVHAPRNYILPLHQIMHAGQRKRCYTDFCVKKHFFRDRFQIKKLIARTLLNQRPFITNNTLENFFFIYCWTFI